MPLPPALSPEARQAALEKAGIARRRRAELKERLKLGSLTLKELLDLARHGRDRGEDQGARRARVAPGRRQGEGPPHPRRSRHQRDPPCAGHRRAPAHEAVRHPRRPQVTRVADRRLRPGRGRQGHHRQRAAPDWSPIWSCRAPGRRALRGRASRPTPTRSSTAPRSRRTSTRRLHRVGRVPRQPLRHAEAERRRSSSRRARHRDAGRPPDQGGGSATVLMIAIEPPSPDVQEPRLRGRGDGDEAVRRRVADGGRRARESLGTWPISWWSTTTWHRAVDEVRGVYWLAAFPERNPLRQETDGRAPAHNDVSRLSRICSTRSTRSSRWSRWLPAADARSTRITTASAPKVSVTSCRRRCRRRRASRCRSRSRRSPPARSSMWRRPTCPRPKRPTTATPAAETAPEA